MKEQNITEGFNEHDVAVAKESLKSASFRGRFIRTGCNVADPVWKVPGGQPIIEHVRNQMNGFRKDVEKQVSTNSAVAFSRSTTPVPCLRLHITVCSSLLFLRQGTYYMCMDPTATTSRIGRGIIGTHGQTKDRMGSSIRLMPRSSGKENSHVTHMHTPARVLTPLLEPACFSVRYSETQ